MPSCMLAEPPSCWRCRRAADGRQSESRRVRGTYFFLPPLRPSVRRPSEVRPSVRQSVYRLLQERVCS